MVVQRRVDNREALAPQPCLNRTNLRPPDENFHIIFTITRPSGAEAYKSEGETRLLKPAGDKVAEALPDRRAADAVRGRIEKYYEQPGEKIEIVHPPVDVETFAADAERGDFWLFVGRLSSYKRADVAVRAFNQIGLRLIVVGQGRERGNLERIASETRRRNRVTLRRTRPAARPVRACLPRAR